MRPVKVLCIGGSDSSGGAGIQADLKAVSVCGCYGLSVITAVTAQNTFGVQGVFEIPPEFVGRQMDTVLGDIGAAAVKTGMLLTSGVVSVVAERIKEYRIEKLVVDPVMLAKGGRNLMLAAARQALVKKLFPLALVVTPNIPEAEKLAGIEIKSIAAMKKAAGIIHKLGVQNVLIKGGHLEGDNQQEVIDILFNGKNYKEYSSPRIDSARFSWYGLHLCLSTGSRPCFGEKCRRCGRGGEKAGYFSHNKFCEPGGRIRICQCSGGKLKKRTKQAISAALIGRLAAV